jgi:serine/threonine-protein kinase RsbT
MTTLTPQAPPHIWGNTEGQMLRSGRAQHLNLRNSLDVVVVRAAVRKLADAVGYSLADQARISAAVYEVARAIVNYAGQGEVVVSWREDDGQHRGLQCLCHDRGLDAPALTTVLQAGEASTASKINYSSLRKLVDEFKVSEDARHGNCVTLVKWM